MSLDMTTAAITVPDLVTEAQVEVYDETSRTWLIFDDATDAEEYGLSGNEDLIADVVPLDADHPAPALD